MPSRNEILEEITKAKGGAQDIIRRKYLTELSNYTKRDTIIISSAFSSRKIQNLPNFLISITNEDIQGIMSALHGLKNNKLDIILHSPGGSLEAVEQIVNYLRNKYEYIRVIIPQNAMSAATMLACAADVIIMGKHSAIGPIDPQITFPTATGHFTAPSQSILDEFELAKQEIKNDPATAPIWVRRLDKYPIGFLKICENTIELSREVVGRWLKTWMFKNDSDKEKKAEQIANWLSDTNLHKTHSRPIDIKMAKAQGLIVEALEDDGELQDKVLSVFHAAMVTHLVSNCVKFIENQNGEGAFLNIEIKISPPK
ncbi:serine protease [Candidatus Aerophobetes bacterium]|uniref:Serine protease n=1 Tax=Aerophobetes bacterium TaxID=2030807 RepID=A0A497E2S4_UNCAE|nr:MAG: serine protease [Candidatus Aerophobetes bacterium]